MNDATLVARDATPRKEGNVKLSRFGALLAVLLIVGVSNWALANDGDPLLLGQENSATNPTSLDGDLYVNGILHAPQAADVGNLSISGGVSFPGGRVTFKTGQQTWTASITPVTTTPFGSDVIATMQTSSTVWVQAARVGNGKITIHLSAPAPAPVVVSWIVLFAVP